MSMLRRNLSIAAILVAVAAGAAGAQQPGPPPPSPPRWPDLSGTWKGTWGGASTTLVIFKRSEATFMSQAMGGLSSYAQAEVGQGDSDVRGTLMTDGRAGPLSVAATGRLGVFNDRLTLILNARPGFGINDFQELVFTSVTPDRLIGSGTSSMQWGPDGPIDLTRTTR